MAFMGTVVVDRFKGAFIRNLQRNLSFKWRSPGGLFPRQPLRPWGGGGDFPKVEMGSQQVKGPVGSAASQSGARNPTGQRVLGCFRKRAGTVAFRVVVRMFEECLRNHRCVVSFSAGHRVETPTTP